MLEPIGFVKFAPALREDPGGCESADHSKLARTAEGGARSKSPVWFRLGRLRDTLGRKLKRLNAPRAVVVMLHRPCEAAPMWKLRMREKCASGLRSETSKASMMLRGACWNWCPGSSRDRGPRIVCDCVLSHNKKPGPVN